jgi:hypothetical protein
VECEASRPRGLVRAARSRRVFLSIWHARPSLVWVATKRQIASSGGYVFLKMLLDQHAWVYRRVESLGFSGGLRIRRQMSIDFQIPSAWLKTVNRTPVPLGFWLRNRPPYRAFDLRDEANNSVPLVESEERATLIAETLTAACLLLGFGEHLAGDTIGDALSLAAHEDPVASLALCRRLGIEGASDPERMESFSPQARLLERLVTAFGSLKVLVADLAHLDRRRILKVGYDMAFDPHLELGESLAITPTLLEFSVPMLPWCKSYHIELQPPEGMGLQTADLLASAVDQPDERVESASLVSETIAHLSVVHGQDSCGKGSYKARFSATPDGAWLKQANRATALCAAVLFTGAALARHLAGSAHTTGTNGHIITFSQNSAAVAVLLTVVGVLTTLIARRTEHLLVSYLLERLRTMIQIVGIAVVAAGGVVAVGDLSVATIRWSWYALGLVAALVSGLLWRGRLAVVVSSYRRDRTLGFGKISPLIWMLIPLWLVLFSVAAGADGRDTPALLASGAFVLQILAFESSDRVLKQNRIFIAIAVLIVSFGILGTALSISVTTARMILGALAALAIVPLISPAVLWWTEQMRLEHDGEDSELPRPMVYFVRWWLALQQRGSPPSAVGAFTLPSGVSSDLVRAWVHEPSQTT